MVLEGNRIKKRIDKVSIFLTIIGIFFLAIFIQKTLSLNSSTIHNLLVVAIIVATISQIIFQKILSKWLIPLVSFIDDKNDTKIANLSSEELMNFVQSGLMYPMRYTLLSFSSWVVVGTIVSFLSVFFHILVFGEAMVIVNTVIFSAIIINMISYSYVKEIIPPLIEKLTTIQGENLDLSGYRIQSVRGSIGIFVGSIITFLILFFLQFIALSSLYHGQAILKEQAEVILQKIISSSDLQTPTAAKNAVKQFNDHIIKGLSNFIVSTPTGEIVAGNANDDMKQKLLNFCNKIKDNNPLFSPLYIFMKTERGYIIGINCNWKSFHLEYISFSALNIFFILLLVFLAFMLNQQISNDIASSLNELSSSMQNISRGEADLTRRISSFTNQEAIHLAHWFNQFVASLSKIIRNVQIVSSSLTEFMEKFHGKSELFYSESKTQVILIENVSNSAKAFTSFAKVLEKNLKNVQFMANDAFDTAKEGIQLINSLVDNVEQLSETSSVNATVLEFLVKKSHSVEEVMESVDQVADETRLLAFNAMLEAVSSGEQGSRFAVVAEGIRQLADNVTRDTGAMKKIIQDILNTLTNLVKNYSSEQKKIMQLSEDITATKNDFTTIVEIAENTASNVSRVMEITSEAQREVKNATENIALMTSSAQHFAETGAEFQILLEKIRHLIHKQQDLTSQFKVNYKT